MKTTKKVKMFITNLRIPLALAEKVKASAEKEKRSMNKEIELALEQKFFEVKSNG